MPLRPYWVTFRGILADGNGRFDKDDPQTAAFLTRLTRNLLRTENVHSPLVSTYGDGSIVLACVSHAPSQGNALDFTRASFTEAIFKAGGTSEFPDNDHPNWSVARILKTAIVEDVEVEADSPAGTPALSA